MSENFDVYVNTLRDEVNALEVERTVGNRGKQIEIGHKLIAIRAALREQVGSNLQSKFDATGNYAPLGWGKWVSENLSISMSYAQLCVKFAVNPEKMKARQQAHGRTGLSNSNQAFARLRRVWPIMEDTVKRKVAEFVIAEVRKEQAQ